jgi:hypothetical protein
VELWGVARCDATHTARWKFRRTADGRGTRVRLLVPREETPRRTPEQAARRAAKRAAKMAGVTLKSCLRRAAREAA